MANFNSMILTNKGQVLYAKGQAGKVINFTKIAVGIGDVGNTDPQTLTDLVSKKFDIAIQSKAVNTLEKVAIISGTLTNENMTESVYIQEIGLYALDPDDGEILYSYASAGEYGDYTSPASNGPYAWNYQVYAAIGNAANVTVTLSNLQYDTSVINSNTTFSIIKGTTQKEINKSIDNKFKIYPTTNDGNIYTITNTDIDSLTDGYPLKVRFNAASTGNSTLIVNNSSAMDIVDYFGNKVSNIRKDLIANVIYDAKNSNFQLLGKGGEGDATEDQVLLGKKVTVNSGVITGKMPDNNKPSTNLPINGTYTIPKGYHPGTEVVTQDIPTKSAETIIPGTTDKTIAAGQYLSEVQTIKGDSHLTPENIVANVQMFGVTGTARGSREASGTLATNVSSQTITLGNRPKVVFVYTYLLESSSENTHESNYNIVTDYWKMYFSDDHAGNHGGMDTSNIILTDTGFTFNGNLNPSDGESGSWRAYY
ncbi:hypothetical protein [Candidatus Clostridium helianthi]|uniref:Uncharacterized protein n=1 Tax=Candidatus Clostridium helianthi TaxID=3381660 RepID=A0ABW8S9V2_9CLOT